MTYLKVILAATALAFSAGAANAASLISNGSFEDGAFTGTNGGGGTQLISGSTALTGWTITGSHDVIDRKSVV